LVNHQKTGVPELKILVTGGAGFIGSNFVRHILDGSIVGVSSVTVIDKLTYAGSLTNLPILKKEEFEFIHGDICDQNLVDKIVARNDVVVNFAAESHVDKSILGSKEFVLTNILGTHTLLESARKNSLQTFIQVSTDEVYGSITKGSWQETDVLLPNSPYAASKASAELIARSYFQTYGLDVRITRSSNNYGRNQFPEKIIPLFVTNLIDNLRVPVYGNGLNTRDWLHVDDNCSGIFKVMLNGRAGEIYNIGGGTELTNIELTNKILKIMDKDQSNLHYVPDRLGHDQRYSVDTTKIVKELDFEPSVSFDAGLKETIDWYIENQSWWRAIKK
jgi:dTDP-glucose 4,6-dehydratase